MNLQQIFEQAGYRCQSYSGRCMYGKYCLGVTVKDVGEFFADVLETIVDPSVALKTENIPLTYR